MTNLLTSSASIVPDALVPADVQKCTDTPRRVGCTVGEAARLDEAAQVDAMAALRLRLDLLEAEVTIQRQRLASLRGRVDSVELGA